MTEEAHAAMADAGIDLSRIACVSVVTRDADALLPAYVDALGLEVTHDMQVSPRGFGLRWIEVGRQGRTLFELMEPTGDGGPVDRFLERRPGGGVYQIRFHVRDLEQALCVLRDRGLGVIEGQDVDGWPRTGWIHPHSTGGVLFELVEADDLAEAED